MALTDKLRAAAFARDKGICAFSGLSVWYLDQVMPVWHGDWPDHIRPVSRGGKHTLDNLVCASFFHNRKKLNNSSDRLYFFRDGKPTEDFYWVHGELSVEQAELLARHAALAESDWYFNRALMNLTIALETAWAGQEDVVIRKSAYWLRSAFKRLQTWRRLAAETDPESFVRRGLVRFPDAPEVRLMLDLARADEETLKAIYLRLVPYYNANATVFWDFASAESPEQQCKIVERAEKKGASEPMLALLRRNARLLARKPEPLSING